MEQQISAGKFDKEALDRLKKEAGDQDTQIQALLTPDQTAAYARYNKERTAL